MNLKGLRAFVFVVEEGSLVSASEKMCLSQPAVSRLIHLMEEDVGTQLFYRDQRSLTPTPDGELYYPEARRLLSSIDEIPELFAQLRDNRLIPLRVVSQMRCTNSLVIPALLNFAELRPEVRFTLDIHGRKELNRHLLQERFDLCVYVSPLKIRGLELIEDRSFQLYVLLHKNHPLASKSLLTCQDLANTNYIALKRGLMARNAVEAALSSAGEQLDVFHEVSSSNAAHRLVAGGLGYTFSDLSVLESSFREHTTLVPWSIDVNLRVGVYSVENQTRHEAMDDFLRCLRIPLDAIATDSIKNTEQ